MERTPNIEVLEGEMRRITVTTPIDREEMDLRMAAAKQFVENYYKTFDANRADLVNLYGEESFVVFEGQKIQGKEAIFAKLTSIQQCRYQFANVNCIPCGAPGGVLVVVSGYMWLDGQQDALVFNQTFQLMPAPEGSFYIAQQLWMTCAFNLRRTPLAMTPLAMTLH